MFCGSPRQRNDDGIGEDKNTSRRCSYFVTQMVVRDIRLMLGHTRKIPYAVSKCDVHLHVTHFRRGGTKESKSYIVSLLGWWDVFSGYMYAIWGDCFVCHEIKHKRGG